MRAESAVIATFIGYVCGFPGATRTKVALSSPEARACIIACSNITLDEETSGITRPAAATRDVHTLSPRWKRLTALSAVNSVTDVSAGWPPAAGVDVTSRREMLPSGRSAAV